MTTSPSPTTLFFQRRSVKYTLRTLGFLVVVVSLLLAIAWAREWNPAPIEDMTTPSLTPDTIRCDTLKVVSWNIGYAGLGSDMDFFYDGGTRMRSDKQRTEQNLAAIVAFLKQHADADFILLQEVDFDSHRSYNINEYDTIRAALPAMMGWWGYNYVTDFVPIPLFDPMGGVRSGVVTLSRWAPREVTRLQYPGGFGFPVRLFNLKRCLLSASFEVAGVGNYLYINNTHNSAYDDGGMRRGELEYLGGYLQGKPLSITMGDWNSNPPGYTPSSAAIEDEHFIPLAIDRSDFPSSMSFVYDATTPSVRYGYEPYRAGHTTTTLLDFALCGSGVVPLSVEVIDLGFENSDHNPVVATFRMVR